MSTTKLALITILEAREPGLKPDQGLPGKPPGTAEQPHPGYPLPTPPAVPWPPTTPPGPDNTLPTPPPGFPVHLPVFPPVGPDQGLPPSGARPDQGLPGSQPKPDQTLPKPGGKPDNTLPAWDQKFELKWTPIYGWVIVPVGSDAKPDQGLPPTASPKR